MYLQKAAIVPGMTYFSMGFEKMTTNFKVKMAYRRFFGHKKKKSALTGKIEEDVKDQVSFGQVVYVVCFGIRVTACYISILLVSCFIWSAALDSSGVPSIIISHIITNTYT